MASCQYRAAFNLILIHTQQWPTAIIGVHMHHAHSNGIHTGEYHNFMIRTHIISDYYALGSLFIRSFPIKFIFQPFKWNELNVWRQLICFAYTCVSRGTFDIYLKPKFTTIQWNTNLFLCFVLFSHHFVSFSPFFASNMSSYTSSSTSTSPAGSSSDVKSSISSNPYPYFGQFNLDWKAEHHIWKKTINHQRSLANRSFIPVSY